MADSEHYRELISISSAANFQAESAALVLRWETSGLGSEVIDDVLSFMESHQDVEYGAPGPLVHFVESFFGRGYEDKLVLSVSRKPTQMTVWMLNRVINGAESSDEVDRLRQTMMRVANDAGVDAAVRDLARGLLED